MVAMASDLHLTSLHKTPGLSCAAFFVGPPHANKKGVNVDLAILSSGL